VSLLCSPISLAQCTGLEMGESPRGDANCVEDASLAWSGNITLLEPSFHEYYSDDVRVGAAPSIEHIGPICTELLYLTPISSPSFPSPPTPCMHCMSS